MRRKFDFFKIMPIILSVIVLGGGIYTVYLAAGGTDIYDSIALFSAGFTMPHGGAQLLQDSLLTEDSTAAVTDITSSDEDFEAVDEQVQTPTIEQPAIETDAQQLAESAVVSTPQVPANKGKILQENLNLKSGSSSLFTVYGSGLIKNSTKVTAANIASYLKKDIDFKIYKNGKPQVLIYHTHATESYEQDENYFDKAYNSRSTDETQNMISVGDRIEKELEAAGIAVIHDRTMHDYPSYNGSYDRSAATIKKYLKKYSTIKVVLDIHRDAIEKDGSRVSAVAEINGKNAAQVMIISGCDDGKMNYPNWKSNLRFAARLQDKMETLYPGLTRPVMFCYRRYNQNLSKGGLLIEVGSHGNTLEEAQYSGELIGKSLVSLFKDYAGS